jgi:predicted nuclease with TOPRIM domain
MTETLQEELLQERVDSLTVASEELRDRVALLKAENTKVTERCNELEKTNKDLSAQVDRLRLHLQQGVEL